MSKLPTTATAQSTQSDRRNPLAEQSITASFSVEIVHDLEDGQPALVASSDANQGDLQVVTVDQVRAQIAEQRAQLNRQERLALAYGAATTTAPTGEPGTWTIADSDSGLPLQVTCMTGCDGFHPELMDGMGRADSVNCIQYDTANHTELLINGNGEDFGGYATLSVEIHADPVHPDPAKRIPVASIEVVEDHYVEDLDPDALAAVIDKLDQRVAAMRLRHAELIRIRDEHLGRQA